MARRTTRATTAPWHSDAVHGDLQMRNIDASDILLAEEAAAFLKMSLSQFRVYDRQGKIPRLAYGRKAVRYLKHELLMAGKTLR